MRFQFRGAVLGELHRSPDVAAVLYAVARGEVPKVAAATPVDSGATAASTRAEGGHRSADGRSVAARIVQDEAGVQQQFGNSRETTPARQFNRALPL